MQLLTLQWSLSPFSTEQGLRTSVSEFTDPVRELKLALKGVKVGLKWGQRRVIPTFNPTLKLALTPRTGSVFRLLDSILLRTEKRGTRVPSLKYRGLGVFSMIINSV